MYSWIKSPATLRRHLCGWQTWVGFCGFEKDHTCRLCQGWLACSKPTSSQLADFLECLVEGARLGRGKHRVFSGFSVFTAFYCFHFRCLPVPASSSHPLNPISPKLNPIIVSLFDERGSLQSSRARRVRLHATTRGQLCELLTPT